MIRPMIHWLRKDHARFPPHLHLVGANLRHSGGKFVQCMPHWTRWKITHYTKKPYSEAGYLIGIKTGGAAGFMLDKLRTVDRSQKDQEKGSVR